MTKLTTSKSSKAHWINAVLIPVKQHVVCCGLVPLVAGAVGGGVGAALETATAEIIMGLVVPPVVTFGVMKAEQAWHNRKARHDSCACAHKTFTRKNFLKQTTLAYAFYAAAHFLLPHGHDHDKKEHHEGVSKGQSCTVEKLKHE